MIELVLRIEMASSLHVGTGIGVTGLLDDCTAKDDLGLPIIPGSTLKGKLRSLSRKLAPRLGWTTCQNGCDSSASPCLVCSIFGSAAFPAQLAFASGKLADLYYQMAKLQRQKGLETQFINKLFQPRFGLRRRRETGVARDAGLFTEEVAGPDLTFWANVAGEIIAKEKRPYIDLAHELALIAGAVTLLDHIGADKARGFGRCRASVSGITVEGQSISPNSVWESLGQEVN